jgi:hypothetical protein
MASDYGLNFGFRRSDESVRVSEGRFKTPSGSAFKFGTLVEIDPAAPGYLKQAAKDAVLVTGFRGLLIQEEHHIDSIYTDVIDSFDLGVARPNKLSVITSGAGVKIWLKNTAAQNPRADGRVIGAVTLVDLTSGSPAVGDTLAWDATYFIKTGQDSTTNAVARITAISGTSYCEAVLLA